MNSPTTWDMSVAVSDMAAPSRDGANPTLRPSGGAGNRRSSCRVIRVRVREGPQDRFEAVFADYPVLVERRRTPWEAVNRLVAGHRALLERRGVGGGAGVGLAKIVLSGGGGGEGAPSF